MPATTADEASAGAAMAAATADADAATARLAAADTDAVTSRAVAAGAGLRAGTVNDRLMVYIPHLRLGGGELSLLRLAGGLAAGGLPVELVVHTLATCELAIPVGIDVTSLDRGGTLSAMRQLARQLRQRPPQWLLSGFPHTNVAAVAARAWAGAGGQTGCVVTEHAPLSHQIRRAGSWRYRVLPPLVRWAYRRADAVVAVSAGVRDDLQAMVGSDLAVDVIANPVLPADLGAETEVDPGDPWLSDPALRVVLSVSRLSVEKDLPTLLRAFALLRPNRPELRLIIAGDGPDAGRIDASIAELDLAAVVRRVGRLAHPMAWMSRAAVFALPSRFEGFGNVLIEAMACGTPVVSTDCPVGPREVLDGGRLGRLVPVGDAAAMAQALADALAEGQPPPAAREAASRFTEARACAAYLVLLHAVRERRGQRLTRERQC